MLCVIAHGTPNARLPAANLLFYYWPSLNPTPVDRRNILGKFNTSPTWTPPLCCAPDCQVHLEIKTKQYQYLDINYLSMLLNSGHVFFKANSSATVGGTAGTSANGSNKLAGVSEGGGAGGVPIIGSGDRVGDRGGYGGDKVPEAAVKMCLDHSISLCELTTNEIW